jgi:AcrR family transcriptional regulator
MARRSDHSRPELAGLVLAAARDIVAGGGAASLTMRGIAARIGYAPGSIYNAVGDLEAVLLRVNAGTLDRLAERLAAALAAGGGDAHAAGVRLAETYMAFVAEQPLLWAAVLETGPAAGAALPEWYVASRQRPLAVVGEALRPLFPAAEDRQRAVVTLWAALQGLSGLAAGGNLAFAAPPAEVPAMARSLVRRFLTGRDSA